jgi:SAM-dependent methyltransferase
MTEWFEEWFGEEYLALYPHRDDREAAEVVSLILRNVPLRADARVLDIACGTGRHARAFQAAGLVAIGVDLSRHLLERARSLSRLPVVRADIRALPFRAGSADLAVNLFTSFGYFATDADHLKALREMIATVRPGGWFVFDFLNAPRVRATVAERSEPVAGAVRVDKWLQDGDRFVIKSITADDGRQFIERVRLFERSELVAMIAEAGGEVRHQFGDYHGGPPTADSPRVMLFAQVGRG